MMSNLTSSAVEEELLLSAENIRLRNENDKLRDIMKSIVEIIQQLIAK